MQGGVCWLVVQLELSPSCVWGGGGWGAFEIPRTRVYVALFGCQLRLPVFGNTRKQPSARGCVDLGCSALCLCGASRTEVTRCGWANKSSIGMPLLLLFDCRGSVVTGCLWSTVQAVLQRARVELGAVVFCSAGRVVVFVCVFCRRSHSCMTGVTCGLIGSCCVAVAACACLQTLPYLLQLAFADILMARHRATRHNM
jgi:hypothetical protein